MSEAMEQATMLRLALEDAHERRGASMSEREGWRVPANYGDAAAEYEAVRGGAGAGLFDLSARGRIEVSGAEATQFLNGLITNDVKTLAAGTWMNAAFPNVQGRLLAFARVVRRDDAQSFLFDTETATHAVVRKTLERFTLAGDFRVRDVTGETTHFSVQGARAADIVRAALGDEAAAVARGRVVTLGHDASHPTFIIRATHTGEDGYDLFAGNTEAHALWDALAAAGARPGGFEALDVLRIEAGVPRYGVDMSETSVVLETGIDDAVSFTKGCYIGQEIIARIHWRGHVAKRLAGLVLEEDGGAAAATRDAKIRSADGKEIGRITSSVVSPRLGRPVALGYVKYDYLAPGTDVVIVDEDVERAARVVALPLVRGSWTASDDAASANGMEEKV